MDTSALTDEELLALYERLQQEVANRQTRRVIADELVQTVDRIVASAPEAMHGEFDMGRLRVRQDMVAVERADPLEVPAEEPEPEAEPEPEIEVQQVGPVYSEEINKLYGR